MSMSDWAKREVELACKKENPNRKEGEFDYGCACYESALKAYNCLMEDGHSGTSFGFTKNILIRLMNHLPLTPIEDTDDVWSYTYDNVDKGAKVYQCTRMASLFKYVHDDGIVTYTDNNRDYCVNINNPYCSYSFGLVSKIIDEMFPIAMPYYPSNPYNPYKVYCDDFLTNPANGDFDTVGIFYAINPNGEKVEINRYFKEGEGVNPWIEIDKDEYERRYERRVERK